ncbi:hypothetical protein HY639_01760 [Candidatus Woesearchaeota archaeon]|nr:hypothetical protein [Candidatus Woesearchaeota archaeon]
MADWDPRDLEKRNLEAYILANGPMGLVQGLFYRDDAIARVLAEQSHPGHEPLKKSLMDVLIGENPAMYLKKQAVAASVDAIPPKAEHGFLPVAVKASAGMDQQIAAVRFLAPLSAHNDAVYHRLWKVARGDTSQMINVRNAAMKSLSYQAFPARKRDLKQVALNPTRKDVDRILAYKIMAGAAMFTDPEVYGLVCKIASDESIRELYKKRRILAPSARFWFTADMKLRREYPDQHRDGKSEAEVKFAVVEKVQKEFQESLFEVINHVLEATYCVDLHNNVVVMNGLQNGFPHTSQTLTKELCRLIVQDPSYHVQNLCKYAEKMRAISKQEAEHIVETLEQVKPHFERVDHASRSWIDVTLNEVTYRLRKKEDGYMDRLYLDKIWKGELTPEQIISSRQIYQI